MKLAIYISATLSLLSSMIPKPFFYLFIPWFNVLYFYTILGVLVII